MTVTNGNSIRIALVLVCANQLVFAPAASAQVTALTARIAAGTPWAKTITDNDANDTDKRVDILSFEEEIRGAGGTKMIVSFRVSQTVKAPGVAKLVVDDLIVTNTSDTPITPSDLGHIDFETRPFPAQGPPFVGRAHLSGSYSALKGAKIAGADVSMTGIVIEVGGRQLDIGTVDPAAAGGPGRDEGPVKFGPPGDRDVTKKFPTSKVQGLIEHLDFSLKGKDRLRVTGALGDGGSIATAGYTAERIITVNSAGDEPDRIPGDGICATAGGACTLRAALVESDLSPDNEPAPNAIHFEIPASGVPVIRVGFDTSRNWGSLGALRPVIIDGTTQPGGYVELDGSMASRFDFGGRDIAGLDLVGYQMAVLGMVVNRFPFHAIQIRPTGSPVQGQIVVEGNLIGTDATGTVPLGNGGDGVHIFQMPANTVVGNIIRYNAGNGVTVEGVDAMANRITSNAIADNAGLAVELRAGANEDIPAPVLTAVLFDGDRMLVEGALDGPANDTVLVELFASAHCGATGRGEADTGLGSREVATDGSGHARFALALPAALAAGQVITATMTDQRGNTSELSPCIPVVVVPPQPSDVPFAGFTATLDVNDRRRVGRDAFTLNAQVTTGPGSDGVLPLTEPVTLQVGPFSATIPAGSFWQDRRGRFHFDGVIGGVSLTLRIVPSTAGSFDLRVRATDAELTGIANPVTVALQIGNDAGATTVVATIR